ncbi:hypothetical protein [Azospirillum doebereinerae]
MKGTRAMGTPDRGRSVFRSSSPRRRHGMDRRRGRAEAVSLAHHQRASRPSWRHPQGPRRGRRAVWNV